MRNKLSKKLATSIAILLKYSHKTTEKMNISREANTSMAPADISLLPDFSILKYRFKLVVVIW